MRPRDFGFDPEVSAHHFVVKAHSDGSVLISERQTWGEDHDDKAAARPKAVLDVYRWQRVSEGAAREFNARLRDSDMRAARWKKGETLLAAHFGRELTLLAWAVERVDEALITNVLLNWQGLAPEERWWLYTTINATFVRPEDEPRGWRRAIAIALAENPVDTPVSAFLSAPQPPRPPARRKRRGEPAGNQPQLDLPGLANKPATDNTTSNEEPDTP